MWANIAIYSNSELRYIAACAVFRVIFRLIMLVFALFLSNVFLLMLSHLGTSIQSYLLAIMNS